ncbi:hypothetical protein HYPSUDRAFT_197325 [Hypholoma sublateritium FD-334 SS-4]|uniref:BHLH domain-containing protein n=1 Tax=Hypholoma sublateritium (strain FD-334 SS-4) TaxID=945553 RepID=A0A0D2PC62_HYPSF|nr:hypothetical protein HYPSUDRAFT_197325 [Hypholoma sublateritium FD-334 SS-4]
MSNMEFDHKPFPESSFESAFTYMDSGLDYFQYPPSPIGVNVGLPQAVAPSMDLHTLNSISDYAYASSSFAPSPPNAFTSQDEEANGVAPQALFYGLSGGELSDGLPSGRASRGSGSRSPAAAPYATVPRSQRFNPIAVPASRPSTRAQVAASHRRTKSARSNDLDSDDDDDEEFKPTTGNPAEAGDNVPRDSASRREIVRKQRIESEQRRRDELRDGYNRLKDTLPPTNQKTSKVSLLDRATGHIRAIESQNRELIERVKSAEHEVHRLRTVNEALMLNRAGANITFN